ncbi:Rha family transcriptional regulator [uncultured Clostridium sp.]|uniref:Rha family transcriptional regulator n=1 Tax=uncultured Clostridium sp. TaxID=59620 RepID=UPI0025F6720D|nr:Rha family transcriptional regulator [uncultured Clostridium sp.]
MENLRHIHKEVVVTRNDNGELVVTSRQVAEDFGKRHDQVLRDIEVYKNRISTPQFCGLFIESEYRASNGKMNKEYLLTRDGFSFLVMGFTGAKADEWKLKYIEAFNKMEQAIKNPFLQMQNLDLANQMMNIAQGTYQMGQVVQGLLQSIGTIQTYVQDSIQAKDHQIDKAMSLIGLRSKNVSSLISKLKEELYKRNGIVIQANDIEYLKAKNKIFKEFKVTKWEEIPIGKYNAVHSFIEIMFDFD